VQDVLPLWKMLLSSMRLLLMQVLELLLTTELPPRSLSASPTQRGSALARISSGLSP